MAIVSPLGMGEHLVIALASAVLLTSWLRARTGSMPQSVYVALGAVAALPLLLAPLPRGVELLLAGKEGVIEALTAGALLALGTLGVQRRAPWVAVGAGLLLLEEVDYGQMWLGFGSPAALAEVGSHSGSFNSHNLPVIEVLWRVIPLAAVLFLALRDHWPRALRGIADRLALPRLDGGLWAGVAALLVATLGTWALAGERRADESAELAVVCLVGMAWWSAREPE